MNDHRANAASLYVVDEQTAASFATALWTMRDWVHRRVETVTFVDADTVQRQISLDFTAPAYLPQVVDGEVITTLVPMAYLAKSPITSLDVRDAAGAAVSVLTTEQNGTLSAAAVRSVALALLGDGDRPWIDGVTADLDAVVRQVTLGEPAPARAAFARLTALLETERAAGGPLGGLADRREFQEVTGTLVDSFVLVAACGVRHGERAILKFSYVEPTSAHSDERSWRERLFDGFGFTPQTYVLAVPGANVATSFHVEIATPVGVGISEAMLYQTSDGSVVLAPPVRAGQPRVHLLAPRDPGPTCQVRVNLRPTPGGWLRSSLAVTAAVAVMLTITGLRLDQLFDPATTLSGDVAALLLAFVGVVAALVVRPGEHGLTALLLSYPRATTLAAVGLPFIGACLLAFGPAGTALRIWWWVLAGCAWLATALLARTYRGPRLLWTRPDVTGRG